MVGGRSPQSQVPDPLASWPGWTTRGGRATSWRPSERRNDLALEMSPGKKLGPAFPDSWRPAPEQERDGVLGWRGLGRGAILTGEGQLVRQGSGVHR